jgi:hypothetical protein
MEQVDNIVSGIKDKIEELGQWDKHFWDAIKRPNLQIMGIEEEEVWAKGIENIFIK